MGGTCGEVTQSGSHNSPYKEDVEDGDEDAKLGDYVWLDANGDGDQDVGETGVANVTVELYDSSGTLVRTTTTNSSGYYIFNNLKGNRDYYVKFVPPDGYAFTLQDQGGDDALDSDANPTNGETIQTHLDEGETDLTWDAGLVELGSIGDYVWVDEPSANGIQDGTESGLDGIRVYLYTDEDQDGEIETGQDPLQTVVTANGGKYLFENLFAGNYIVKVDDTDVGDEGLNPVPRYQDGDTAKDSNGSTSTPYTSESVSLASGENNLTIDFGYYSPPTAVTLSSFAAKSNAGGSGSWLWLGLVGLTVLAAGSLFWAKRRAG
jgi:hypothetical protein